MLTDSSEITNPFNFRKGQVVEGRYEILDEIGTGGLSIVYTAKDLLLNRVIAIKLLRTQSSEYIVRLQREAKAICQLKHKNIIEVYDFFMADETVPVLAMEYVDGESLDGRIRRSGPLSQFVACDVFEQICEAIAYAHDRHILHRDLKPANVLLRQLNDGKLEVKIIDFGIAKILNNDDFYLTISGTVLGTPSFLSPEQASGQEVDQRSDIYSLGCLMYKALTGRSPFRGQTAADVVNAHILEEAPSLSQGNNSIKFSDEVERVVARALQKEPEKRFQSMKEFGNEIAALRSTPGVSEEAYDVHSEQIKWSLISLVTLAILCVAGTMLFFIAQHLKTLELEKLRNLEIVLSENQLKLRSAHNITLRRVRKCTWLDIEGKVKDDQLIALSQLDTKRLDLSKSSITDKQLIHLVGLPLIALDLRETRITNQGVDTILKINGLQTLLLEKCPGISSQGYRALSKLKTLKILSLRDSTVSDQDLEYISKLPDLVLLYVSRSPNIGDPAIDQILKMEKLVALRVGGTKVTTRGIEKLRALQSLIFLGLDDLNLSDELMPASFNQNITMLDLSRNPLTIKGLRGVIALRNLWYLNITNCNDLDSDYLLQGTFHPGYAKVLDQGYLPECEFYFDPDHYNKNRRMTVEERRQLIDEIGIGIDQQLVE